MDKENKAKENEVNAIDEEESLKDYIEELNDEIKNLKTELDEAKKKSENYFDMLTRTAAEYDNFTKRTQKEKESIRTDVTCDSVGTFIPVLDNLERAVLASAEDCEISKIREGINLVLKQMLDVFDSIGVKEIEALGRKFDANFHDAVMHVEDEEYGDNEIIEVFQKGYMVKGKVIRHSVVKVAN